MPIAINDYDGPGYIGKGVPPPPKRDGLKKTIKATVRTFQDLGRKALNAADYERTMHLPVGKGRLACDPDTGDFDEDATRLAYRPSDHAKFPMHIHSTITEGEHLEVRSEEDLGAALATKKWSLNPLEKKRRFTLTAEDTLLNLQAQLHGERARGLEMERRLESVITGGNNVEAATMMGQELEKERQARLALEARMEQLIAQFNADKEAKPAETDSSESVDEGEAGTNPRSRRRVAA